MCTLKFSLSALVVACLAAAALSVETADPAARGIGISPGPAVVASRGEVWPKPQQQRYHPNYMVVRPGQFTFKVVKNNCDILQDAMQRYMKIIENHDKFKTMARSGAADPKKSDPTGAKDFDGYLDMLKINLLSPCEAMPYFEMDEKYELRINSPDLKKEGLLTSSSIWGVLRGLETFSQLLYLIDSTGLAVNSTSIMDFPRFPHRGLLLDTSRHYIPLPLIYQILNAMSMNKFNVFHWHIVDDQSFPYQSTTFPLLSQRGAYTPRHVYTQDDVKNVIKFASLRGIRVIAEFDTPGHTRSWGIAHPEILTPCYKGNAPDGTLGPMNPIANTTYIFMDQLLNEIKRVFPDKVTHLGGDEVDYACWESNPLIANYAKQHKLSFEKLEEMYVKKVLDLAKAKALKSIVWQEVFDNGLNVPQDTIIHVWKGNRYLEEMKMVTGAGYTTLLSSPWYLDHLATGGDWVKFYNVDPTGFNGTEQQKGKLIGGEACMWSEVVDSTNVMTRIWPRACATAEKLWSAANVKSYQKAARRLEEHVCRLNMRGIPTQPANGPGYCPFANF